jgi:hypothetical protein
MKLTTRVVVPLAVGGVLAVGAAAIAWADSPSPSPTPSAGAKAKAGPDAKNGQKRGGPARHALHGEFVVPQKGQARNQDGPAQTTVLDTQRGEITAIDKAKKTVTIKSRDNFTRTYVVNDDTKIRSKGQDESFNDLQVGERAMIVAEKSGDNYVARTIRCVHEPKSGSASQSGT